MEIKKSPSADIYSKRPLILSFSFVISLSVVIAAMESKWKYTNNNTRVSVDDITLEEILEIPSTTQPPPPAPFAPQPKQQIISTNVVETLDVEKVTEQEVPIVDQQTLADQQVQQAIVAALPEEEVADEIFLFVESPPEFIGGEVGLLKFIKSNLNYPMTAKRMELEGRVFIKAVIEKDGSVSNAKVVKGIGTECDEEALRVIKLSPKWIPGKQRGKNVKVQVVIPIYFKLRKEGFVLTH